jgi:hypothetical protein
MDCPYSCCRIFFTLIRPAYLPLFVGVTTFFFIFRPKIACQAPKPLNPLSHNNIRMKLSYAPAVIIKIVRKKSRKPGLQARAFFFKIKGMKTLEMSLLIRKTLRFTKNRSPNLKYLQ